MADERPQIPDFYAVLGVGFDASNEELRAAWRTAVKQWHPDRNRSPEAHSMMAQINEAWEVLGDAERRAEYDTVYFQHRSAMADQERKRREAERRERERQQREAEETRRRRMEEERRRAESAREEPTSQRQQRAREESRSRTNVSNRRGAGDPVSTTILPIFWSAVILVLIVIGVAIFSNSSGVTNESDSAATRMAALTVEPSNPTTSVNRTRREYRLNSEPWRATPSPTTVSVTATPTLTTAPTPGLVPTVPPSPRVLVLPSPLPTATVRPTLTSEPTPTVAPSPTTVQKELNPLLTEALWTELTRRDSLPDPDRVAYLVDLCADVNSTDSKGMTMFEYAVLTDYELGVVQSLSAGVSSDSATEALWVELTRDPLYGPSLDEVTYYIALGADVLSLDSQGRTMLEYATSRARAITILQLLSAGVSVEDATKALWATLYRHRERDEVAYRNPSRDEVAYLIDLGADIHSMDQDGRTMFEYAVGRAYAYPVVRLLSDRLSVEAATKALWAVLYRGIGAEPTHEEIDYLLGLGADVSVLDSFGRTMFEYATSRGYGYSIVRLLTGGLSAEVATKALWATLYRDDTFGASRDEILRLIGLGADVSSLDSINRTMFEYALDRDYDVEILKLLEADVPSPSSTPTATAIPTQRPSHDFVELGAGTLRYTVFYGGGCRGPSIAYDATSGNVEFSFEMPSASDWSIGLLYHRGGSRTHSATYVFGSVRTGVGVGHWTRVDGLDIGSVEPVSVPLTMYDGTVGALNDVAIQIDADGTSLELNGTLVLHVPASELRPSSGEMQVCAGLLSDEWEDYGIDYIDLRAWTE